MNKTYHLDCGCVITEHGLSLCPTCSAQIEHIEHREVQPLAPAMVSQLDEKPELTQREIAARWNAYDKLGQVWNDASWDTDEDESEAMEWIYDTILLALNQLPKLGVLAAYDENQKEGKQP